AAAAVATHLVLLLALVTKGTDYSAGKIAEDDPAAERWGLVPTRLDAVTFYLSMLVYGDQEILSKGKGDITFSVIVGFAELIRTTLILLFVSCLARAAGDEEVSHNCTRAAGFASIGPGALALAMFLFTAVMVETKAGVSDFSKIIFSTLQMGIYAI